MSGKILFIDHDKDLYSIVQEVLALFSYSAESICSREGLDEVEWSSYSLLMIDWTFPGLGGMKIYDIAREKGFTGDVIMMSARNLSNQQCLKFEQLSIKFLAKPFTLTGLTFTVAKVLEKS